MEPPLLKVGGQRLRGVGPHCGQHSTAGLSVGLRPAGLPGTLTPTVAVCGLSSPISRTKKWMEKLRKEVSEIPSKRSCSGRSSSAKGQKEGSVKLALNCPPCPAAGTQSPTEPSLCRKAV